jgi:hypothetical protein
MANLVFPQTPMTCSAENLIHFVVRLSSAV